MIFCVEDDPNIRELEVYTLKSTGFPAIGLETSEDLFKALETGHPCYYGYGQRFGVRQGNGA